MTETAEEPRRRRPPTRAKGRASEPVREVCPYLLAAGGGWRSTEPTREHRCTATAPASPPSLGKQRDLCLQPAHFGCATYLAARELEGPARTAEPADGGLWPETRSAVLALEPVRGRRAALDGTSGRTAAQALLVGLMIVAFLVLALSRVTPPETSGDPAASIAAGANGSGSPSGASGEPSGPPAVGAASPSSDPAAVPTSSPAAGSSGGPSSSPAPAPTVSATPAASPTPSPSPAQQSYRVRSGDTLSSIAARFGVTIKALKAANQIGGSNVIRPGQVLVIPPAR